MDQEPSVPSQSPTADLVIRAKSGDHQAFEALVRAYLRAAYSVALATVGRPADAEDVAQEALLVAFERLDTCREPARFGGWLLRIVRNQALETTTADATAFQGRLLDALRTLSPLRREIVLLHELEGWTHSEIADALGISELMSRQHLFLARRDLRLQLELRQEAANE
jgi:DNA-directed RNA polymerase specialized sigma24 family protein